jgi:asparagine synthase (glutamine-hydrolysing)
MCGLCGFLNLHGESSRETAQSTLSRMTAQLRHRGPDDSGLWQDPVTGIGLGHTRLAILDLSPEGHQPMQSADGRFVLVFNGEIYNHRDLRRELERGGSVPAWRGHSDTEVLLAAIVRWGLEAALKRSNGMFALALWDRQEKTLQLARDRLGEKPMYYGMAGRTLLFGSELKALRVHPAWIGEIDRDALSLLMRHMYIPAPYSIYQGIAKLPPGTFITFSAAQGLRELPQPVAYWSARHVLEKCWQDPLRLSDAEATDALEELLRDAVGLRMEADVPLGAFLSGGIDSSTVVALMQAQSRRPVRTFSIGFREDGFDEAVYARAVAAHLGTEHTELYVEPEQAWAVIPDLPTLYDEPFADSSQIPTYLVSKLARQHVTVALSGDGGDELFAGYRRYARGLSIHQNISGVPAPLRRPLGAAFSLVPTGLLPPQSAGRLELLSEILKEPRAELLYRDMISHWRRPEQVVINSRDPATVLSDPGQWPVLPDFLHFMMYADLLTYLPDDVLAKVDRASMGVSLEARVPLLDHRLAEFAWRLPGEQKRRNGQGKWLLRQVLDRHVPRAMVDGPKRGFRVPIDSWLRGPLREWAEELLSERVLREGGYFQPGVVRKRWQEHLEGKKDWHDALWNVLVFNSWLASVQVGQGALHDEGVSYARVS